MLILSIGFGYILSDRVVLGTDYYPEANGQEEGYRGTSVIPMECVKEIKERKEANNDKPKQTGKSD